MECVPLLGAEQVSSAGYTMRQAAQEMQGAASHMESCFLQQQRFLDDWLMRLSDVLQPRT